LVLSPFDVLVGRAVGESMAKILGPNTWKAVNFYFDTRIVAREPEKFTKILDRLFGSTSKVLQKDMTERIFRKVGSSEPISSQQDLRSILKAAKIQFAGPSSLR
jgi:hypothetical protein